LLELRRRAEFVLIGVRRPALHPPSAFKRRFYPQRLMSIQGSRFGIKRPIHQLVAFRFVLQNGAEQLLQARLVVREVVSLSANLPAGAFQFLHQKLMLALPLFQFPPQIRSTVGDFLNEALWLDPAIIVANIAVQSVQLPFEFFGTLLVGRLGQQLLERLGILS
jgi:hypothetical protein